jgi:hypothetical protein
MTDRVHPLVARWPHWRVLIDDLNMAAAGATHLDEDLADRFAESIVEFRSFSEGPAAYLDAIDSALRAEESLASLGPHDDATLRGFLRQVRDRLRSRQPWPEPVLRKLPSTEWASFTSPVGRLDDTQISAHYKIGKIFDTVVDGTHSRQVLLLRLQTGEEVGLFAPEELTERGLEIRQRGDADPATVLKHFAELTGYPQSALTATA